MRSRKGKRPTLRTTTKRPRCRRDQAIIICFSLQEIGDIRVHNLVFTIYLQLARRRRTVGPTTRAQIAEPFGFLATVYFDVPLERFTGHILKITFTHTETFGID